MGRNRLWTPEEIARLKRYGRLRAVNPSTWTFERIRNDGFPDRTVPSVNQAFNRYVAPELGEMMSSVVDDPAPVDEVDYEALRRFLEEPRSLAEICNRYDRSPQTVKAWLRTLEAGGFRVVRTERERVSVLTTPAGTSTWAQPFERDRGAVIPLGVLSDVHAGGLYAQPSALRRFTDICYHEYGVRHFLIAGDVTTGLYVYRGQSEDLVPAARPLPGRSHLATRVQAAIASSYIPRYEGAMWYILGGNHDWDHVKRNGFDPVWMLCQEREDCVYLGYDAAGLWLTDKIYIRLWHPTGGIPYAKSYRLQKGIETLAIEALKEAIKREEVPVTSLLIAGHLHISLWLPTLPIPGLHPGCFEGKTNYEKRKGYEPDLGGVILRLLVGETGRVLRIEHSWIPYEEVEDDWRSVPLPEQDLLQPEPDPTDILFHIEGVEEGEFPLPLERSDQ